MAFGKNTVDMKPRMAKSLARQQGLLLDQVVGFQLLNHLVEFLVDGNVGVQDAIHTLDHISWHCHGLKGTADLPKCQSCFLQLFYFTCPQIMVNWKQL